MTINPYEAPKESNGAGNEAQTPVWVGEIRRLVLGVLIVFAILILLGQLHGLFVWIEYPDIAK